jgi:hypothetical protein
MLFIRTTNHPLLHESLIALPELILSKSRMLPTEGISLNDFRGISGAFSICTVSSLTSHFITWNSMGPIRKILVMPDFAIDISILKEPLNSRNACWCA